MPRHSRASKNQLYEIILWLHLVKPLDDPTNTAFQNLPKAIDPKSAQHILSINNQHLSSCTISSKSDTLFTFKLKLNVSLEKGKSVRHRRSLDLTKDQFIDRILNFRNPFELSYAKANFTVFKVTSRILGCINLQKYHRREYTVLSRDSPAVVIIRTKELLQASQFYTLNDTSANNSRAIFICRNYLRPNCSAKWVLMNEDEFIILQNRSVYVNSSKRVFDLQSYIWANRSVFVCENFSRTYQRKRNKTEKADQHLVILTYICMSISIISLVFVLATYSLFAELRTPPGINLMNLSVAMLLAKLLWLLGSGQTDKPIVCAIIAVLLHYFFLVSFVWTSIIAFDTWRAFTSKGRRSMADSKRKRVLHSLRYIAVGWISVLVYTAICVVLDMTNTVYIGYRPAWNVCWMDSPWAILYFFSIPVGIIIVFNATFFIMTLKAINNTKSQTKAATGHKSHTEQSFGVYVRMASVMGFTWILGFIAPFGPLFVWYLFTIMTCLEGLYIALAFGINKRVRNLYKKRFPVLARSTNTVTNDTNKSNSKFEKLAEEQNTKDTKL